MSRPPSRWLVPVVLAAAAACPAPADDPPRERTVVVTYAATVTGLTPGAAVRVWLPVPPANADQDVAALDREAFAPARLTREPEYGNDILYVEGPADAAGSAAVAARYRVRRRAGRGPGPAP